MGTFEHVCAVDLGLAQEEIETSGAGEAASMHLCMPGGERCYKQALTLRGMIELRLPRANQHCGRHDVHSLTSKTRLIEVECRLCWKETVNERR